MRRYIGLSYAEIGRHFFSGREHTTIVNSFRVVSASNELKAAAAEIWAAIGEGELCEIVLLATIALLPHQQPAALHHDPSLTVEWRRIFGCGTAQRSAGVTPTGAFGPNTGRKEV
jgi:hypothetical protein